MAKNEYKKGTGGKGGEEDTEDGCGDMTGGYQLLFLAPELGFYFFKRTPKAAVKSFLHTFQITQHGALALFSP